MQRRRRSAARRTVFRTGTFVALAVLLVSALPSAGAAKPVRATFYIGCDPQTAGDPYVKYQQGTVGGGAWTANFSSGYFNLTGKQFAASSGGGNSVYDLWPWIHFGPGSSNKYGCVTKSNGTSTTLAFRFVQIQWSVRLSVNCSDNSTANASYALNVTGDMVDYRTGGWLVSPKTHVNHLVAQHSVACTAGGGGTYGPRSFRVSSATASTGTTSYTMASNGLYMYFAQPRVFVAASTTGHATARATVSHVTVQILWAHCPGC